MNAILILALMFILFMIYVAPVVLIVFFVVYVITRKSIDITSKILIILIIMLCILIVFATLIHIEADKPDELYIKMKQINDSKTVIGLSKEEVTETLGKPAKIEKYKDTDKEVYLYRAGQIFKEVDWREKFTLWAKTYYYVFFVNFDEASKVESTYIKESLELYMP